MTSKIQLELQTAHSYSFCSRKMQLLPMESMIQRQAALAGERLLIEIAVLRSRSHWHLRRKSGFIVSVVIFERDVNSLYSAPACWVIMFCNFLVCISANLFRR